MRRIVVDEDLLLREWKFDDIDGMTKIANNKNVSRYMRDGFPFPYTQKDALDWVESCQKMTEDRGIMYCIEYRNKIAGGMGFFFNKSGLIDVDVMSAEIGYWLGEEFWGKGIMTKAITCATSYVFKNFDIERISAAIFSKNEGSKRVLEKSGYTFEGRYRKSVYKDGVFLDSLEYAKLRDD